MRFNISSIFFHVFPTTFWVQLLPSINIHFLGHIISLPLPLTLALAIEFYHSRVFFHESLAAHVFPIGEGHGSRDDSYREGLDNLLRVLTCIGEGAPIDEIKDKVRNPKPEILEDKYEIFSPRA